MLSRIIVAALLIASAIFAAVRIYWPDIIAQPASAAAFLGALAGAGGGLLAIILGALINAELNRRRDDRLRREEAHALAAALVGELETFAAHCQTATKILLLPAAKKGVPVDFLPAVEVGDWTVFDRIAGQIGLLGTELPDGITAIREVMDVRRKSDTLRGLFRSVRADSSKTTLSTEETASLVDHFKLARNEADGAARTLRQAIGQADV